jgi:hypothetical protein
MAKAGRGSDQFPLRLPDGLRDRIKQLAEANGRSMNAEIVSTLEEAYPDPEQYRQELKFLDEIDDIQKRLDRMRAAQLAEAAQNFDQGFLEENAEKIRGTRTRKKDGGDD